MTLVSNQTQTAVTSICSGNMTRPPICSVHTPRKIRLIEPVSTGVATRRPNWLSLSPSSVFICTPMIEKIVQTAKHTVKAKVLSPSALYWSEDVIVSCDVMTCPFRKPVCTARLRASGQACVRQTAARFDLDQETVSPGPKQIPGRKMSGVRTCPRQLEAKNITLAD